MRATGAARRVVDSATPCGALTRSKSRESRWRRKWEGEDWVEEGKMGKKREMERGEARERAACVAQRVCVSRDGSQTDIA